MEDSRSLNLTSVIFLKEIFAIPSCADHDEWQGGDIIHEQAPAQPAPQIEAEILPPVIAQAEPPPVKVLTLEEELAAQEAVRRVSP